MRRISRRNFITDLGRGTVGVVILGAAVVGCSDDNEVAGSTTTSGLDPGTNPSPSLAWQRVSFSSVSAYVLARGSEVAIVDTGTADVGTRFDDAFAALSVGWSDVDHVLLTHLHSDHVGGLGEVLDAAPEAKAYAGEADVAGIDSPRALTPVNDGDEVFGLQIVGTPGHTAGHVSVFDEGSGLLVAGDALVGSDGSVGGPSPNFSVDIAEANSSVAALADLGASTVVLGHGDPVESDVAASIDSLAQSL